MGTVILYAGYYYLYLLQKNICGFIRKRICKKLKIELEFISHIYDTFVTKLIKIMNDFSPDIQVKISDKYPNKTSVQRV